jgi:hypothetical protein
MHQIDISCVFCVRANTVIVLCVRPVRNVHKCQYRLITTEQLTITHQYSYSYSDTHLCICQDLYVFSVMIACRYRTRPTLPRSCNFKFKPTDCCVHTPCGAFCLHSTKPLLYMPAICRHFLFATSLCYFNHNLQSANRSGGLAAGNDKR